MVKDRIEIRDCQSLDALVNRLSAVRDALPASAEPEVRMGCDPAGGNLLAIWYRRPQTAEEAACEARYAAAYHASRERERSGFLEEPVELLQADQNASAGAIRLSAPASIFRRSAPAWGRMRSA